VFVLIVRVDEVDIVVGLDVGVDDYVIKLFCLVELLVCVWVLLC